MLRDSGFRRNDGEISKVVIPAKAGIQRSKKNHVIQNSYSTPCVKCVPRPASREGKVVCDTPIEGWEFTHLK
jgi:hypothetical protein